MAGSNPIDSPSSTLYQRSSIALLASMKDLQGSSLTDMSRSMIALMGSANTLQESANTLKGSANTLQASANTLTKQSVTDLIISGNDMLRNSVTDLQESANDLVRFSTTNLLGSIIDLHNTSAVDLLSTNNLRLISLRDVQYKAKGNFYSHFDNCRSVWSTVAFGYTSWGQTYAISAGANGGAAFSFDGGTKVHFSMYAGETLTMDRNKRSTVSVKCASTTDPAIRIITWG